MTVKSVKKLLLAALLTMPLMSANAQEQDSYKVAACDWMMLKRQKLGEFKLTKEIGADGVELDMGPLGKRVMFENRFRNPEEVRVFKGVADSLGVKVSSVAMSGFFAQNFIQRQNYLELVGDCINTMKAFGTKVAFLPLGGSGKGWMEKGAERDSLIAHLHNAGELAKQNGMVIGIRTSLDAKNNIKLLKEVKSDGIKIYYSFQDAADNHRDICKELKTLGKKRIIQIHASNTDSVNLPEDPDFDMKKIKHTLDRMGWRGWLVVERSRDVSRVRDVKYNFSRNVKYLKEVFAD